MFRVALVVSVALAAGVARVDAAPGNTSKVETKSDRKKSESKKSESKKSDRKKSDKKSSAKKSSKRDREAKSDKKSKRKGEDRRHASTRKGQKGKQGKGKKDRHARVARIPTRKTLARFDHMPNGFSWPPTPAMIAAEKECEAKLARAGVEWERAEPEGRIANPIIVPSMTFGGVKYSNRWGAKGPHKLDCQLALALETIGPELYALGVREVKFGSIFRWTNVRSHGKTKPILSRHGLGIAMDIASFVDDTGRMAVVSEHYTQDDPLLHGIEAAINANGNFRTLLTPKNDPISHDDHFHIEARADYTAGHP